LGSDKGGLWKEVIESKYDSWRSLKKNKSSYNESLWWRDLKGFRGWRSGEGILRVALSGHSVIEIIFCFGMMCGWVLKL